jgi:hypothetical protein
MISLLGTFTGILIAVIGRLLRAEGCYLAIGDTFLPPDGKCWAVVLIWCAAHVGGYLITKVNNIRRFRNQLSGSDIDEQLRGCLSPATLLSNVYLSVLTPAPFCFQTMPTYAGPVLLMCYAVEPHPRRRAQQTAPSVSVFICRSGCRRCWAC